MNNIPILLSILFYNDINKNLFLIVLYSIESRVQIELFIFLLYESN